MRAAGRAALGENSGAARIANHRWWAPLGVRLVGTAFSALVVVTCLDDRTATLRDTASAPPYPVFIAIATGKSYALPADFSTPASVRVVPEGVARIEAHGSILAVTAVRPGFADWD